MDKLTFRTALRIIVAGRLAESPCPSDATLTDYANGQLDADEVEVVMEHISLCRGCCRVALGKIKESWAGG
jgi:hypothetical protein